jgi:hypothetical protein
MKEQVEEAQHPVAEPTQQSEEQVQVEDITNHKIHIQKKMSKKTKK